MAADKGWILVLNAGSSSLKFAAFDPRGERRLASGQIAAIGAKAKVVCKGETKKVNARDHAAALEKALGFLQQSGIEGAPAAAGHRLVHGAGQDAPALLTREVRADIEGAAKLAPLHNPPALKVIDALNSRYKTLPQVVCFDTAFHAGNPKEATVIPIPRAYREKGIRRYGFHGLSYASLVRRFEKETGDVLPRRVLALHLGAGASIAAIVEGKGVATSMGFSPMDGLVMATRSGAIDPGVLLHLMRAENMDAAAIEKLLNTRSGLSALAGGETDMKALLARGDPEARFAVSHYCYWVSRHAGSMIAAMQGLDGVIFTGGVGENAATLRDNILARLAWAGTLSQIETPRRSKPEAGGVKAWVVASDEEGEIARSTQLVLG